MLSQPSLGHKLLRLHKHESPEGAFHQHPGTSLRRQAGLYLHDQHVWECLLETRTGTR
jgi:hypothetical protein